MAELLQMESPRGLMRDCRGFFCESDIIKTFAVRRMLCMYYQKGDAKLFLDKAAFFKKAGNYLYFVI